MRRCYVNAVKIHHAVSEIRFACEICLVASGKMKSLRREFFGNENSCSAGIFCLCQEPF